MVRKGGQHTRAPVANAQQQQQQQQAPQQKRGRGRQVSQPPSGHSCPIPDLGYANTCYHQCGYEALQPAPPSCFAQPIVRDLGMALQRMGVLPIIPAASERKLALPDPVQSAHLQQLNAFLDHSYELQQRGHQLWVAEQLELQRGAELAIISPPSYMYHEQEQPAHFHHHQTPTKASQAHVSIVQTNGSPTDVLMSPQTTSTLLAAAMASQGGLSPSMTGSAAAQLLSPSALGLHPLLLQDLPHSSRRRLGISASHSMLSPNGTTFVLEPPGLHDQGHSQQLTDHMDHMDMMPASNHLMYNGSHHHGTTDPHCQWPSTGAHHHHSKLTGSAHSVVCSGVPATTDMMRSMREHMRQQPLSGGSRTPRTMMLQALDQVSPLSPADLLVTAAMAPQAACMDVGLLGAYTAHHHHHGNHDHLDGDMHADLRLESGGQPSGHGGDQGQPQGVERQPGHCCTQA